MKQILYFFILLIILNQSLSEGCDDTSIEDCTRRTVSDPLQKCAMVKKQDSDEEECTSVAKTCEEALNLKEVECSLLTPKDEKGVCITGEDGCEVTTICDKVISGSSEEICPELSNSTHVCSFIAANPQVEGSKAHCESAVRPCTDVVEGVTVDSTICSARTTENALCYFDGQSSCKKPTSCAEIVLSTGATTKELCSFFNTDNEHCLPKEKTCTLISVCNKAEKTDEHDCSYYPVVDEKNECVLKEGTEKTCIEKEKPKSEAKSSSKALDLSLALLLIIFVI